MMRTFPVRAGVVQSSVLRSGLLQRCAVAAVLVLLLGGCRTSGSTVSTVDDPGVSTAVPTSEPDELTERDDEDQEPDEQGGGFNDPSAGPDRAADEPREVPPLSLPASAPGSDEAAQALINELDRFITDEQRADGVPWPDMRNPDPVAVYMSDADFQRWMSQNNPTPSLVDAYTAPGSPERDFDLELFDLLNSLDLRSGPGNPPYSMRVEGLVRPAATGITDALLAQVPDGSAAIIYWDSAGSSDVFTADGQYYGTNDGWTDVGPWVAIMAPTDVGWQVWWDELTEPPPPGSREQKGTPQDEAPRIEV